MKNFIESWAAKYDENKYSTKFYYYFLNKVKYSKTPEELGNAIICLLHWKDGKVIRSDTGKIEINSFRYSLGKPKPNTYEPQKHKTILISIAFYDWAQKVIDATTFSPDHINALTGAPFYLWGRKSIIIPAFVLHVLSPMYYPLYDQHVERAKRALLAVPLNKDSTFLNLESYKCYQNYFVDIAKQYAINGTLEEYKIIDKALWSFGKWLKKINNVRGTNEKTYGTMIQKNIFTPDMVFKKRVLFLLDQGHTQLEAMKIAANEREVTLADSYYKYPGSHLYRWKKQL